MKKQVLFLLVFFASASMAIGQLTMTSPYWIENKANGFPWTSRHIQQGAEVVFVGSYNTEDFGTVDSVMISVQHLDGATWGTISSYVQVIDGSQLTGQPIDSIIQDTLTVPEDFDIKADFPDDHFLFQARVYYDPVFDTYGNEYLTLVAGYDDSIAVERIIIGEDTLSGAAVEQLGDLSREDVLMIKGHYGVKDAELVQISLMHLNKDWGTVKEHIVDVYNPTTGVGHKSGYFDEQLTIPADFSTAADLADGDFFTLRTFVKYASVNTFSFSWLNIVELNVSGVSLDMTEMGVEVGASKLLTATVEPSTALDQSVTWSSSDAETAHVENGLVSGMKNGMATITVTTTDGEFTATCDVTVGTGSIELGGLAGVSAYPNPVKNMLHIDGLMSGSYNVSVYNMLGSRVMNLEIEGSGMNAFSVEELPAGNYLLDVRGEEGRFTQKISK